MTEKVITSLELLHLELQQSANDNLAFAATGQVVQYNLATGSSTPLAGIPPMQLGIGQEVIVPPRIRAAFATNQFNTNGTNPGLWFATLGSQADDPAWFASLSSQSIDLYGIHDLADNALQLSGMAFSNLSLTVTLQLRGTALQQFLVIIDGNIAFTSSFANIEIIGAATRFNLMINLTNLADLDQILKDPASVLDAAFLGRLTFLVTKQSFTLGDFFQLNQCSLDFELQVSSPANQRLINTDDVQFSLTASSFDLLDTRIEQLYLACRSEPALGRISMHGSAKTTLPSLFTPILDTNRTGTQIDGSFNFEHRLNGNGSSSNRLDLKLDRIQLASAVNILELSARDVTLSFVNPTGNDNAWELTLSGTACQSWNRIAQRLADAGILRLPRGTELPDLRGTLLLNLTKRPDGTPLGLLNYRLDFLQPGTGCQAGVAEPTFDGPLDPLPVRLTNSFLSLSLAFTNAGVEEWTFSGAGQFSTIGWLHNLLPITSLGFSVKSRAHPPLMPELELRVEGGMPTLTLPPLFPNATPLGIFQPTLLSIHLGEVLEISGDVVLRSSTDLVTQLNLPAEWNPILQPISQVLRADLQASLRVQVPITDANAPTTLTITIEPPNPPTFELMRELGRLVSGLSNPDTPNSGTQMPASEEFFKATPANLSFVASVNDNDLSLSLSFSLYCSVFGEDFDATASLRVINGEPEFLLMAGLADPIRLTIPGISPDSVLGNVDLQKLIQDYHLDQYTLDLELFPDAPSDNPAEALAHLEQLLRSLFALPGMDASLVFEIRDFGLRVRRDQSPGVSGTVRLIQLPDFLDAITPENGFDFGLGCSTERIFISVKGPATRNQGGTFEPHTSQPLLSIPLGQNDHGEDQFVHLYFGQFELEYSWATHAFGFVLDAAIIPEPASLLDLNIAGNGVFIPAQHTFIRIGKPIATAHIPIVIPEWVFSFLRSGVGPEVIETAADELGLQLYFGTAETRYLTLYFRENSFSPNYFLMQPGAVLDGGVIIGPHQPRDYTYPPGYETDSSLTPRPPAQFDQFFQDLLAGEASDNFIAHLSIEKWQLILIPSSLGIMLNPLALIPPFLSPMPPFWIAPPLFMGDIYANHISMSINIPQLLFFSLDFQRPLPMLSLQGLMEIAALVMTGFQETIPRTSELYEVLYVSLDIQAKLPLIRGLVGEIPELTYHLEANVADVVNGLIRISQAMQDTFATGINLVETLQQDPSALVRMVPLQARRFALLGGNGSGDICTILGIAFSGSLYVLTPEEFEHELILFHENRRLLGKGLAASQPGGNQIPPASGPIISDPRRVALQDQVVHRIIFISNPLRYFDPRETAYKNYIEGQVKKALNDRTAAYKPFFEFRRTRDQAVQRLALALWQEIQETRIADKDKRARILQEYGVAGIKIKLENVLKTVTPAFTPASQPIHSLPSQSLRRIETKFMQLVVEETTPNYKIIKGLDYSPATAAQAIVAETVRDTLPRLAVSPLDLNEIARPRIGPTLEVTPGVPVDPVTPGGGSRPVITIIANPSGGPAPLTVQFSVLINSSGPVTSIMAYVWDFGDETVDNLASPTHTYNNPGTYQITVACTHQDNTVSRGQRTQLVNRPTPLVTIVDKRSRERIYAKHVPKKDLANLTGPLEQCFAPYLQQVAGGLVNTPTKVAALRQSLQNCIQQTILGHYLVIFDSLKGMQVLDVPKAVIEKRLKVALTTQPIRTRKNLSYRIFDGLRTGKLLADNLKRLPTEAASPAEVEKVVGYEIRSREKWTPIGEVFALPVLSPTPQYKVQMQGGDYCLRVVTGIVEGKPVFESHPLPAWLTDLPESPRKAALIRNRLIVTERIERRPRTAAEAAFATSTSSQSAEHFYQTSIMARPEYQLKDTGGVHGPLYIADLLKRANGSGYVIPESPLLLAGFKLDLWGNSVGLAGLIAGPDNIFLNGFYNLTLAQSLFSLELTGDFHLIAGQMWREAFHGQSTADSSGLVADSLSFNGMAEFKQEGVTKFKGSASGTVRVDPNSPLPELDLMVKIEYHDSWTIRFGDSEVFKVTLDTEFDLKVSYTAEQEFTLIAEIKVDDLKAWMAVPQVNEVVVAESATICATVPVIDSSGIHWEEGCVITPEVTVPVPDLTNLKYDKVDVGGWSIEFELSSTEGLIILLEADILPEPIRLPRLLNG